MNLFDIGFGFGEDRSLFVTDVHFCPSAGKRVQGVFHTDGAILTGHPADGQDLFVRIMTLIAVINRNTLERGLVCSAAASAFL